MEGREGLCREEAHSVQSRDGPSGRETSGLRICGGVALASSGLSFKLLVLSFLPRVWDLFVLVAQKGHYIHLYKL